MHELRQAARTRRPTRSSARCSTAPAIGGCCWTAATSEDQERLANIEELITAAKQFAAEDATPHHRRFPGKHHAGQRPGRLGREAGLRLGDDAARRQGAGVSGGLHGWRWSRASCRTSAALASDEEVEEERRLAFVGMTRAKEELYLSHARMREFRGQTLYAVPSMFLRDLPAEAIEHINFSAGNNSPAAFDDWRGGGMAAEQGWNDAGVRARPVPIPPRLPDSSDKRGFVEGMLVQHPNYGKGRIVEVSGQGALRRIKIRFATAGERTFIADKVNLEIVDRT